MGTKSVWHARNRLMPTRPAHLPKEGAYRRTSHLAWRTLCTLGASRMTISLHSRQPDQSACRVICWLARLREILRVMTRRRTQAKSLRILREMRTRSTSLTRLDRLDCGSGSTLGGDRLLAADYTTVPPHLSCAAPRLGFDSSSPVA